MVNWQQLKCFSSAEQGSHAIYQCMNIFIFRRPNMEDHDKIGPLLDIADLEPSGNYRRKVQFFLSNIHIQYQKNHTTFVCFTLVWKMFPHKKFPDSEYGLLDPVSGFPAS